MSIWDEWKQAQLAKQHKPGGNPPAPKQGKEPVVTRPVTEDELRKMKRLQGVSTAWWCGDKRFIQQYAEATTETQITERQAWWLDCLEYKYRKQLKINPARPAGYKGRE